MALPVQPAKQAAPAVVPVGRVGQAPGHQGLALQGRWEQVEGVRWAQEQG